MSDSNATILIVDDESGIRRLLRRALEKEAFHVLEAENGSQLMQIIQTDPVDLVTLDLSLGADLKPDNRIDQLPFSADNNDAYIRYFSDFTG